MFCFKSSDDQSHHTEMSIVLLGAKLVGKSSTGNTILSSETFDAGGGTALCSQGQGAVAGRTVTVVDTPGWWTNTASLEDSTALTRREIEFSACLCPPGPLAFLLVVNLNQPFEESYRTAVGQHVELLGGEPAFSIYVYSKNVESTSTMILENTPSVDCYTSRLKTKLFSDAFC